MKKLLIIWLTLLGLYGSAYAADCQTLSGSDQAACIQTTIANYQLSTSDTAFVDAVLQKIATATDAVRFVVRTIVAAVDQWVKVQFDYHTRALFKYLGESMSKQSLALCLTQKGVTMYGTERCPHCQNQKKLFASAFVYIHYVDCDLHADECNAAHIEWYPTRVQWTTMLPGTQELTSLAQKFACSIQ